MSVSPDYEDYDLFTVNQFELDTNSNNNGLFQTRIENISSLTVGKMPKFDQENLELTSSINTFKGSWETAHFIYEIFHFNKFGDDDFQRVNEKDRENKGFPNNKH